MKSIDKWTAGCYVTVFSALIEYCVVLALVKSAEWERRVREHLEEKRAKMAPKLHKTNAGLEV